MKLPRWLVVTLLTLSALSVLGAGAWWWVTWPTACASEFKRLLMQRQFSAADLMYDKASKEYSLQDQLQDSSWDFQNASIIREPEATAWDVVAARGRFVLRGGVVQGRRGERLSAALEFTVKKGRVMRLVLDGDALVEWERERQRWTD